MPSCVASWRQLGLLTQSAKCLTLRLDGEEAAAWKHHGLQVQVQKSPGPG